ncbi:hypothetical protein FPV67DRAFT_1420424 [Lyophyllum atratum]|nr:hypothetical protein FPV67DRAFT_1420424 [Lyophyllum atratum]
MVACTPTKKARILEMKAQGKPFLEIGNALGIHPTTASRNYDKLMEQGENPDFYTKTPIPGRPRALSPHAERRAKRAITSGECSDATDVQRELFPHVDPSTVRRMFIRMGMHGRIRSKKAVVIEETHYRSKELGSVTFSEVDIILAGSLVHR